MKLYRLLQIVKQQCPPRAFREFLELAPESVLPYYGDIKVEAYPRDEAKAALIDKMLKFCEANGLSVGTRSRPGTCMYEVVREYEPSDFRAASYLNLNRQKMIDLHDERDEQGRLLLPAVKARSSLKVGRIDPNYIIVSSPVRRILEAGNFVGLAFAEVALKGQSIHAAKEPFWELKSSVVLPPFANTDRLVTVGHVPFDGDYKKMVWIDDPPFRSGEIHYRNRDLQTMGAFDIARTLENYREPHPALVISQRFYQHCAQNKIPLNAEPVQIDPD